MYAIEISTLHSLATERISRNQIEHKHGIGRFTQSPTSNDKAHEWIERVSEYERKQTLLKKKKKKMPYDTMIHDVSLRRGAIAQICSSKILNCHDTILS